MMPDDCSCKIKLTDTYYNTLKHYADEMDINVKKLVNMSVKCANKQIETMSYIHRVDTICMNEIPKPRSFKIDKECYETLIGHLEGTNYSIKEIIREIILYYPGKIFAKYTEDMNK